MDKRMILKQPSLGLYVIAWLCVVSLIEAQQLVIEPHEPKQTRALGQNIVYTCGIRNSDPTESTKLVWLNIFNRRIEYRQGRIRISDVQNEPSKLKLYITDIQRGDVGRYTCQEIAVDPSNGRETGKIQQASRQLDIFKDIQFDDCPLEQYFPQFTNIVILCRVSGNPTPDVNWYYRGNVITAAYTRHAYTNRGLQILNVTQGDAGLYECGAEVSQQGQYTSQRIQVHVTVPPKMISGIGGANGGTMIGIQGKNVDIKCVASGKPAPLFKFYKDGHPTFLQDTGRGRRLVDERSGAIHFRPLIKADQGSYRCVARSIAGTDSIEGNLQVIEPPTIHRFNNDTKMEGETGILSCYSHGDPPSFRWKKWGTNEVFRTGDHDGGRIRVVSPDPQRSNLIISNLRWSDTQNYTCYARNLGGEANMTGQIVAEFTPRFLPNHPTSMYNWRTRTRNMTCTPQAEPVPIITFYHRREPITHENETFRQFPRFGERSRKSYLQIRVHERDEMWVFGEYICVARNKHGEGRISIDLLKAEVPDAPENAEIISDSPTRVKMTVKPPKDDGGMPIYGYVVEYETYRRDFWLHQEIIVEDLLANHDYVFNVRAKSEVGIGRPFPVSHETGRHRAPFSIKVLSSPQGLYPYTYVLRWEKPRTGGVAIIEYIFKRTPVLLYTGTTNVIRDNGDTIETRVLDNPQRPMLYYTFRNLEQLQGYRLEIQLRNSIGYSPTSSFVFYTASRKGYSAYPVAKTSGSKGISLSAVSVILLLLGIFSTSLQI